MLQRDYIMRLIERFTQALAAAMFKKKNGELQEAAKLLEKTCDEVIGLELDVVKQISIPVLLDLFNPEHALDLTRIELLAKLLKTDAELMLERGDSEAGYAGLRKSLALLLHIHTVRSTESIEADISELFEALPQSHRTTDLRRALFSHFERTGAFAKAEDILFELVDLKEPDSLSTGRAFFQRLMQKNDLELEKGGLPRAELVQGLADLEKVKSEEMKT